MNLNLVIKGVLFSLFCHFFLQAKEIHTSQSGRILFLIQQGDHSQALNLYMNNFQANELHDFELLHHIGLGILDFGYRQSNPEIELLSLLGASVSAHEGAYYILEAGLKNRYPQIQLIALNTLARLQSDKADQTILKAMGSTQLLIRLEALKQLCLKNHPASINQAESLMYKTPEILISLYPPLIAAVGTPQAIRVLRKLLHHPSETVRLSVIHSIAKYKRDDLLPQIRQQAFQGNQIQQEACAHALGAFHDGYSKDKLQKLTFSPYPTVALAAHLALYKLGINTSADAIEAMAKQENLFAIQALGEIPEKSAVLTNFLDHSNPQLRINAVLALLNQKNTVCFPYLKEIILRHKKDYAFVPDHSPGRTFKIWKIIPSASQIMESDLDYQEHITLKESVVETVRNLSEPFFIVLAHAIFESQQNELIPLVTSLLEEIGSHDAVNCLKAHQQQLGAPFVRHYCNLALYRLQEKGPYAEQLRQWVKTQRETEFIRFKGSITNPWKLTENSYQLAPAEASQLLIKIYEAFAINQDTLGIEALLEAISQDQTNNKYALAGILLRATQ
ncbi:HEAT repeat domain-containing protein [Candidatus Protochlamydia amoebophila]|uniref:HEAT repeat domain-containing protein n=1 Tax=Protochlamydia amoebophila (strain UWE25) TaxID=264201 RepID=Q6MDL6_PARUW|nr:hypothetical protein [Candidatus Protochlamydia amoebophila]CAF23333.1 unnamed protein product [Candidatus Protochlamydia amoebophila UWE25]